MDRLILLFVLLMPLVGCQTSQTYSPFGLNTQSRVPPPPTGAVGNSDNFYGPPPGSPPLGAGAFLTPEERYGVRGQYDELAIRAQNQRTVPLNPSYGGGFSARSSNGNDDFVANTEPTLQRNPDLSWKTPDEPGADYAFARQGQQFNKAPRLLAPSDADSAVASRQMYTATPNTSPHRVRGFDSVGTEQVYVPEELADRFQPNGVRQANAMDDGARYSR